MAKSVVIALHSALAFVLERFHSSAVSDDEVLVESFCIDGTMKRLANRPVMASPITEVWKGREHTLDVAGYAHRRQEDYLRIFEYR